MFGTAILFANTNGTADRLGDSLGEHQPTVPGEFDTSSSPHSGSTHGSIKGGA